MIFINGKLQTFPKFPDGTSAVKVDRENIWLSDYHNNKISWFYDSDEELPQLWHLAKHISEVSDCQTDLFMPYIPNARMDRCREPDDVHTLRYFTDLINMMNFHEVTVMDPHSDVSTALLSHVVVARPDDMIQSVINGLEYDNRLKTGETVKVAEVSYHPVTGFSIKHYLSANQSVNSREVWGIKTMDFVPVTTVMYSPNYWDDQNGVGNKHYFFMLKDCVNTECPNGFYNEFMKQELNNHRHVLEALGSKLAVVAADDQLSGIGFSSTKRNDLIVKVTGAVERVLRIKF